VKYQTSGRIDLKKLVDLPYGTSFHFPRPLKFWVTYGGNEGELKGCVDDTEKADIASDWFNAGVLRLGGFPVPSPPAQSWSTDIHINVYS